MGQIIAEPVRATGDPVGSGAATPGEVAGFTEFDLNLFREGTHRRLYRFLGARPRAAAAGGGADFAVWAPRAQAVSVIGSFNGWQPGTDGLKPRADGSGIWEGHVAAARPGGLYKYRIDAPGLSADRPDPFARWTELPPGTASRLASPACDWDDVDWLRGRADRHGADAPIAIYELHPGSWRRMVLKEGGTAYLGYRELAAALADHVAGLGFTHVLLLAVPEHPHDEPPGQAVSAPFAPSARHGAPQDLMALIDGLHRRGIGVILDWSPLRLAAGADLTRFDGEPLLEAASGPAHDPSLGDPPASVPFDLDRPEVRALLLSSALFWLDVFHADGLRMPPPAQPGAERDARVEELVGMVAGTLRAEYPDVLCIAERAMEPAQALDLYQDLDAGARLAAAFAAPQCGTRRAGIDRDARGAADAADPNAPARRLLALSHDLILAGGSLLARMPGDSWQQRANLRLLLGWLYGEPGRKLCFMGTEFAQFQPWRPAYSLDWHLLDEAGHRAMMTWVRDLNRLYRQTPALREVGGGAVAAARMPVGVGGEAGECVVAVLRQTRQGQQRLLAVFNLGPDVLRNCRVGVPAGGPWDEVLNSDAWMYGGSDRGNLGGREADPVPVGDQYGSLLLTLPPLGVLFLTQRVRQGGAPAEPTGEQR